MRRPKRTIWPGHPCSSSSTGARRRPSPWDGRPSVIPSSIRGRPRTTGLDSRTIRPGGPFPWSERWSRALSGVACCWRAGRWPRLMPWDNGPGRKRWRPGSTWCLRSGRPDGGCCRPDVGHPDRPRRWPPRCTLNWRPEKLKMPPCGSPSSWRRCARGPACSPRRERTARPIWPSSRPTACRGPCCAPSGPGRACSRASPGWPPSAMRGRRWRPDALSNGGGRPSVRASCVFA